MPKGLGVVHVHSLRLDLQEGMEHISHVCAAGVTNS